MMDCEHRWGQPAIGYRGCMLCPEMQEHKKIGLKQAVDREMAQKALNYPSFMEDIEKYAYIRLEHEIRKEGYEAVGEITAKWYEETTVFDDQSHVFDVLVLEALVWA